jgi:hypothetical protein
MKRAALVASTLSALVPAVASACPGAANGHCGAGLSSLGGYVAAVGIGLLVGIGSIALEKNLRKK